MRFSLNIIFLSLSCLSMTYGLQLKITDGLHQTIIDIEEFENFPFVSGEQLILVPQIEAAALPTTPDGHKHVLLSNGKAVRIPPQMILTPFKEYLIPEHLCLLTGAGSSTLDGIGRKHVENYVKYMGLWPEMTFLEIGCGIGRDVFQLLPLLETNGKYIGIDVTRDAINWLDKNVSSMHSNFQFFHFDAWHQLYNPCGTMKSSDFALPASDHSVDRIALGSVFTHLFEDEVVHYLKEIKRVLAPDGRVYATFFLFDEKTIKASRSKSQTPFNLRFEYPYADGCYVNDPVFPTGAVAYNYSTLQRMFNEAGLKLAAPLVHGAWSGAYDDADDGQEVAILMHSDKN